MIDLYIEMINEGRMSIDDVPDLWREAVAEEIKNRTIEF